MAGLMFEVNIPVAPLAAGAPTVVAFLTAPPNQRVKLKAYGFFFDGQINSGIPVEIKLARLVLGPVQSMTAGGTANLTVQGLTEKIQSVFGLGASSQPTLSPGCVFKTLTVHPQQGYEYLNPLYEEEELAGGQTWIALATAQAPVNIRGYFRAEE
jgi:hypothetical protein